MISREADETVNKLSYSELPQPEGGKSFTATHKNLSYWHLFKRSNSDQLLIYVSAKEFKLLLIDSIITIIRQ